MRSTPRRSIAVSTLFQETPFSPACAVVLRPARRAAAKASAKSSGAHFRFKPYNYGPFDKTVYAELEALAKAGYVEIITRGNLQEFRLTPTGQQIGNSILTYLPSAARDYVQKVSAFVRRLSFSDLV